MVAGLVRPIAGTAADDVSAELFALYGGLRQILAADPDAAELTDLQRASLAHLRQAEQFVLQLLREPLHEAPVLDNGVQVETYLRCAMGHLRDEQIRVLHLDATYRLIRDDVIAKGKRSLARVGLDDILRRSVLLDATAIILAHNHPSGLARPSQADIDATRQLARASRMLEIELLDHWIVTSGGGLSLREAGLL